MMRAFMEECCSEVVFLLSEKMWRDLQQSHQPVASSQSPEPPSVEQTQCILTCEQSGLKSIWRPKTQDKQIGGDSSI